MGPPWCWRSFTWDSSSSLFPALAWLSMSVRKFSSSAGLSSRSSRAAATSATVPCSLRPDTSGSGEVWHIDDQTRIERLVLNPAAPVHLAARVAHDAARPDSIVALLMRVAVDPEHGHIKESIRKLADAPAPAYNVTFGNVLHRSDVRGVARQGVGYASGRFLALQEMK